ncbi:MAG TPA: hypothetical protein VGB17_04780 [Pyrinomonadaceae bacterium]|jgi:hypothetical protein
MKPLIAQSMRKTFPYLLTLIAVVCLLCAQAFAQTAADTQIKNQASATYSDTDGGSYDTVSNIVTVTVAKVSGLTISPDAASDPNVVAGQTGLLFSFQVTNTGNFSDQVRFLASGASVHLSPTSPASITRAVIDVNNSGTIDAGDTDIKANGADVLSSSIAQNASISVLVEVSVNSSATAGQTVQVYLGDASGDNQAPDNVATPSAHEVRTVGTSVNGVREARGDRRTSVDNDAQLQLSLTAPTGPVPLGSNITYAWQLCNTGARSASSVTLTNAPAGSNTGVFIIAPVPAGTALSATQSFPAGVGVLYSTSALSTNPVTEATWAAAPPTPLSSVTRVALNTGSSLASGACSASINLVVTITKTDATDPVVEQGDAYGRNTISTQITAQSPQRTTTLVVTGDVLNGPQNKPDAIGPNNTNDDYTNKSVSTGIAGIPSGGSTTAEGTVNFTNTVKNTGNANDTFTLSVQSYTAGSTVKLTVNGTQVTVVQDGAATGFAIPTLSLAKDASADYQVEVKLPSGKTVLTGYDTVIRATSGNTSTVYNETIDRVYTGFLKLEKVATVNNSTGVGSANDPVPGAVITFEITYTNVSSTGGTNNVTLTATNIVITENGSSNPNNWATYTDQVVGSASDTRSGAITGDAAGSSVLTDTVASLAAGQYGIFTFRRQIK